LSGFWAGFGKGFQSSFEQTRAIKAKQEENRLDREFTAEQRREAAAERRREALMKMYMQYGASRSKATEKMAQYAGDVTWLTTKLSDYEGAEEILQTVQNNPKLAAEMREQIREQADWAAKNHGKRAADRILNLSGEEFMRYFEIVGGDPSAAEPGDIAAVLPEITSYDGSEEEYLRIGTEISRRGADSAPTSTVVVKEPLAGAIVNDDWDDQVEIVQRKVSTALSDHIRQLEQQGASQDEITTYMTMKQTLGKDEGMALEAEVKERFYPEIIGDLMTSGLAPGIEDNPNLNEYIPEFIFESVSDVNEAIELGAVGAGNWVYVNGIGYFQLTPPEPPKNPMDE